MALGFFIHDYLLVGIWIKAMNPSGNVVVQNGSA
jgi:hypothetical protein